MATTYDEVTKQDAISKVAGGQSVYKVAKAMKASPATVRRWCVEAGQTVARERPQQITRNDSSIDLERVVGRLTIENMQLREQVRSAA